jgi:hypothetical protein
MDMMSSIVLIDKNVPSEKIIPEEREEEAMIMMEDATMNK